MVSVKTIKLDAKEQRTRAERARETRVERLAREFNELCGDRHLEELERAKDYFDELRPVDQKLLRGYHAKNGEMDLLKFADRLKSIYPSGTAGQCGKILLEHWVAGQMTMLEQYEGLRRNSSDPKPYKSSAR